jgi:uncharacterized protein
MSQPDAGVPLPSPQPQLQPDYRALTRFLMEPLMDTPNDLHVSCETTAQGTKVWLRVSLGETDRGRAFGRGGRNIRAIRTILQAAGNNADQVVSLEIIGGSGEGEGDRRAKPKPRRGGAAKPTPKPKPKPKLRSQDSLSQDSPEPAPE